MASEKVKSWHISECPKLNIGCAVQAMRMFEKKAYPYSGWINVKDMLPSDEGYVLVYLEGDIMMTTNYSPLHRQFNNFDSLERREEEFPVTHWMPLPEPPKEE